MAPRRKPKIVYIDDGPSVVPAVEERIVSAPEPKKAPPADLPEEVAPSIREPKPLRRRPSVILMVVAGFIIASVTAAFIFIPIEKPVAKPAVVAPPAPKVLKPNCLGVHPDIEWGYELHDLTCDSGALEDGQSLGDLLMARNVDYRQVLQVMDMAKRKQMPGMRLGSPYYFMYSKTQLQRPVMFVYEPEPSAFVFMNLEGPPAVHLHGREVLARQNRLLNVIIQTTLAENMYNRPSGLLLTRELEAAIKWKVDLFHLNPGDRFLLLYEETQYEGNLTQVGDLMAVSYRINGKDGWAFSFMDGEERMFYDQEARPMKSGFLMAPLEYGRISSTYNLKRLDPIARDGSVRAHLGTDYAAPEGTPILAVGDGTVMAAEFKGGNGNYVKLHHTDSIQTQYLHMSAFADGIEPGVFVKQGQVIGFVGSTGRSTGPHVCFRYWKNGAQVDHRQESNFGASMPLRGDVLQRFLLRRDSLMGMMTEI